MQLIKITDKKIIIIFVKANKKTGYEPKVKLDLYFILLHVCTKDFYKPLNCIRVIIWKPYYCKKKKK